MVTVRGLYPRDMRERMDTAEELNERTGCVGWHWYQAPESLDCRERYELQLSDGLLMWIEWREHSDRFERGWRVVLCLSAQPQRNRDERAPFVVRVLNHGEAGSSDPIRALERGLREFAASPLRDWYRKQWNDETIGECADVVDSFDAALAAPAANSVPSSVADPSELDPNDRMYPGPSIATAIAEAHVQNAEERNRWRQWASETLECPDPGRDVSCEGLRDSVSILLEQLREANRERKRAIEHWRAWALGHTSGEHPETNDEGLRRCVDSLVSRLREALDLAEHSEDFRASEPGCS